MSMSLTFKAKFKQKNALKFSQTHTNLFLYRIKLKIYIFEMWSSYLSSVKFVRTFTINYFTITMQKIGELHFRLVLHQHSLSKQRKGC